MKTWNASGSAAVIVAHPDDETLWAGGTILSRPSWRWFVLSLCRGSDSDRAPKFFHTLKAFGAEGSMCDLDDGPEQIPLNTSEIKQAILQSLPSRPFDLILTHSPAGEYTRHRRHEEVGEAVIHLWFEGQIQTDELWLFAYEDGEKHYLPRAIRKAQVITPLPHDLWRSKYEIITKIYGFKERGFEAETTPLEEAFWRFTSHSLAYRWLTNKVFQRESSALI